MTTAATLISFGYGHSPAPAGAHLVVDVREHFRDPHINPALRGLTAHDPQVIAAVAATPGVHELVDAIVGAVRAFLAGPTVCPVTVAVGCVGGRHRSAAIALLAAEHLERDGIEVTVAHRDLHRPVIDRDTHQEDV